MNDSTYSVMLTLFGRWFFIDAQANSCFITRNETNTQETQNKFDFGWNLSNLVASLAYILSVRSSMFRQWWIWKELWCCKILASYVKYEWSTCFCSFLHILVEKSWMLKQLFCKPKYKPAPTSISIMFEETPVSEVVFSLQFLSFFISSNHSAMVDSWIHTERFSFLPLIIFSAHQIGKLLSFQRSNNMQIYFFIHKHEKSPITAAKGRHKKTLWKLNKKNSTSQANYV